MPIRILPFALLLLIVCASLSSPAQPNDRLDKVVENYTNGGTLAVAVVDLDSRWVRGVQQEVGRHAGNQAANQPGFALAAGMVDSLRAAGAGELVMVVGGGDLNLRHGPIFILTTEGDDSTEAVRQLAGGLRQMIPRNADSVQVVAGARGGVLVGQPATVERYQSMTATPRPDLSEALATARSGGAGQQATAVVAVALGDDARRVVRELWPRLPAPFDAVDQRLLADELKHLTVRLVAPPEWEFDLRVQLASDDAANKVQQAITAGYDAIGQRVARELTGSDRAADARPPAADIVLPRVDQPDDEEAARIVETVERVLDLLAPQVEESTVRISVDHQNEEAVTLVRDAVAPALEAQRAAATRSQSINNLKQLALAMHNFHSSTKQFPAPAAIVDRQGRPLLSWRVAVLPYIEQSALFREFRLDEPWDSPHNLKLAQTIPSVYVDPMHPHLAAEGKTTYQLPVHPRSAFPPSPIDPEAEPSEESFLGNRLWLTPGTQLRNITDGTSNTVMIVQMPPEQAVVWTKPADWEVDLAQAWQQLQTDSRQTTSAAYCDGSVHTWDLDDQAMQERLPKLITRDGREVIDW